jgi:hypothetical protein
LTARLCALELLADSGPGGCSGALLLANGVTIEQLDELVRGGLVNATPQQASAGLDRTFRITEMGRQSLYEAMNLLIDPDAIYFPDPEAIAPLAMAFARMMFAHAKFEDQFRSLQGAVTSDPRFGERRTNQWTARQRPDCMAKLIKKHFPEGLEEAELITTVLNEAVDFCDRRNLLAHGEWWYFHQPTLTVTVRSGTQWMKGRQNMRTSQPQTSVRLPRGSRTLQPSYTISAAASRAARHVLLPDHTAPRGRRMATTQTSTPSATRNHGHKQSGWRAGNPMTPRRRTQRQRPDRLRALELLARAASVEGCIAKTRDEHDSRRGTICENTGEWSQRDRRDDRTAAGNGRAVPRLQAMRYRRRCESTPPRRSQKFWKSRLGIRKQRWRTGSLGCHLHSGAKWGRSERPRSRL